MSKTQCQQLLQEVATIQQQCILEACELNNQQLDKTVPLGRREVAARFILYQMVGHPREHTVHLQKVLQKTGASGAQPNEAQLILGEAAESFGDFVGLFARMSDEDLDREYEGHSPRKVLEHMKSAYQLYLQGIQQAKA